jgi:hypothetical protein
MIRIEDFGSEKGSLKASRILAIIAVVLALAAPAYGEAGFGLGVGCHTRTGDLAWDARLRELDTYFGAHRDEFITDLCEHYRVSRSCVLWLLDMVRMSPADTYITIRLHRLTLEPVNTIVDTWKANRGQGWVVIARKLGMGPGSAEFSALKRDDRGKFYARANGQNGFKDYGRNR